MEAGELSVIELKAQRARELLEDDRFQDLKQFIENAEYRVDEDIHEAIRKGVCVERIMVLEQVSQFLAEFKASPYGAISSLRGAREEAEIEQLKKEIER